MKIRTLATSIVLEIGRSPTDGEVALFKEVRGKPAKPGDTVWLFPRVLSSIYSLHRRFPHLDIDEAARDCANENPDLSLAPEIVERLYPYQVKCVQFLVSRPYGALLAPSPGLGKSAIAIRAADALELEHILVVAPLSLLYNWQKEIGTWSSSSESLIVRSSLSVEGDPRWIITNYETLRKPGFDRAWDLIIFDESILLKSRDSLRTKVAQSLSRHAARVWLLSGSPISRSADDLFAQFQTIVPHAYTSFWRFVDEYCITVHNGYGVSIVGTKQNIDFQREFADIYLPIARESVLDLPPEIHERIELEVGPLQQRLIDRLLDEYILESSTREIPVTSRVSQIVRLLQVTNGTINVDPSIDESIKHQAILDLIESQVESPISIWGHFKLSTESLVRKLRTKFPKLRIEHLSAETSPEERAAIVEDFQSGQVHIIVSSLGVGKFGLTLTKAKTVIYAERSFDADALVQSSYRVSRIGLDHSPTVITLATPVDALVDENLSGKLPDIGRISGADWTNLLRSLRHQ